VANDSDNYLKNISFLVSSQGIDLSLPYDQVSACMYHTRVFADHLATRLKVAMMIPIPGATIFGEVTKTSTLAAADILDLIVHTI
jgi:hypothetical protein